MTTWLFTITEYEADRRWVVVSTSRDSVELDNEADFYTWAHERWPKERYRVELDREPFRWTVHA